VADLPLGAPPPAPRRVPRAPVPWELRLFERLLWPFARAAYRRHRALPPAV